MTTPDKEEMPTEHKTVTVEVVSGRAGECLCINDRRVAGPKPWGGGAVVRRFDVPIAELQTACNAYEPMREALAFYAAPENHGLQQHGLCFASAVDIDEGERARAALSTLPVNDRHHSGSDSYQADAGAPALSEKVTLPSEQEAFLLRDFASYLALGPEFVSAYRAGLSSAMGICDLLADEFGSRNKGARRASDALNLAADRIERFRSKCTAKLNFSNDAGRDGVSLKPDTSSQPASEAGKLSTDEVL